VGALGDSGEASSDRLRYTLGMLHIHNGDVTAALAARAGLPGRHMPFREALMSGPVPAALGRRAWLATRLAFITGAYDVGAEETLMRLLEQEDAIDRAAGEEEIVLWFEHDLFCLINLLYVLHRLSGRAAPGLLYLIWSGDSRNGRVRGLGTFGVEEIRDLFEQRRPIGLAQSESARRAWSIYTNGEAAAINAAMAEDPAFPFLGTGMRLHAERFPSVRNGLGRIEQEALDLIAGGDHQFRELFSSFSARNSGYGLGDSDFAWTLTRLERQSEPLIRSSGSARLDRSYELTERGDEVRTGAADNIAVNGIDLWLGGAHLQSPHRIVRWNGSELKE
jgi:hypothetical protein